MNDDLAVSAQGVSKAYRIWQDPSARLKGPAIKAAAQLFPSGSAIRRRLVAKADGYVKDFFALREVSFDVKRGRRLGIVGRNGSGKSTLLQIIAGTMQPSAGSVSVQGRVAALLELGSGFNPEFTGRENVFLNAAVLGLSRAETEARFSDICAFADIGEFLDQPVRTYSSGMQLRLAFAVAVHVDADILIIDEALSVGDARFQLKCARAIDRFVEQGKTLLFVSHDLSAVKRLCSEAILLERGECLYHGHPNDVVNLYSKVLADDATPEKLAVDIRRLHERAAAKTQQGGVVSSAADGAPFVPLPVDEMALLRQRLQAVESTLKTHPDSPALEKRIATLLADERSHKQVTGHEFSYGGELGQIYELIVTDEQGVRQSWFESGQTIRVSMRVQSHEDLPEPIFALTIKSASGVEVYGTNTLFSGQATGRIAAGECREVEFAMAANLMPGEYFLSFGFTHFFGDKLVVAQRRYDAIKLDIHRVDRCFGIANLWARITSRPASEKPASVAP